MEIDTVNQEAVKIPVSDSEPLSEHDSNNAAGHSAPASDRLRQGSVTQGHGRAGAPSSPTGLPKLFWNDIFHYTMTASWPAFFTAVGVLFMTLQCPVRAALWTRARPASPITIRPASRVPFTSALRPLRPWGTATCIRPHAIGAHHRDPRDLHRHVVCGTFYRHHVRTLLADRGRASCSLIIRWSGPFNGKQTLAIRARQRAPECDRRCAARGYECCVPNIRSRATCCAGCTIFPCCASSTRCS